jgi:hypothetical protein
MAHDFFDPAPEQQNVVLIDAATLQEAQRMDPVLAEAISREIIHLSTPCAELHRQVVCNRR